MFNETSDKIDLLLLATKLIEKVPDATNAKQHYQAVLKNKNKKSVKRSKITTQQPKAIEKPNITELESVFTEHPKNFGKLSKTIRQAEKVSQVGSDKNSNSSLYSETKELKIFLIKEMQKCL